MWPRKMCPECVRSFVVLLKNKFNNEAKLWTQR
jgi:hypothetical protein